MLSFLYKCLTQIGAPVIHLYLLKRRSEGREDAARFAERLGKPSKPRPLGRLVWCHAASVGEAVSLLIVIEKIGELYPDLKILITTGTVTSATMLEGRLPPNVIHQYMPVDRLPYVASFLKHWMPDFVVWIESELWPNMLSALRQRLIPVVLLNGRMSEKSFQNWYRAKSWAKELLGTFALTLTQTEDIRARFVALGAKPVRTAGNLKYAAKPLPVDDTQLSDLQKAIGTRPCWLMASTHRGEEDMALIAHKALQKKWPNVLTIIVPRHAVRGDEIEHMILGHSLSVARRSKKQEISHDTSVYLADTMGELGLFYRLAPVTAIGGSFIPVGGHNPVEAAQLGCGIMFGPHMFNFTDIAQEFIQQQAALALKSGNEIAFTVDRLLSSANDRANFSQNARRLAEQKRHVIDVILAELHPWLNLLGRKAA